MNDFEYTVIEPGDEFAAVRDPDGYLSVRITKTVWRVAGSATAHLMGEDDQHPLLIAKSGRATHE